MKIDIVNIGLAFLEGFALIISPCILPIFPIILASSLTGSKKRPIGIIFGFVFIFSIFTFFSRKLVLYTGIDLNLIRYVSYGVLYSLAIIMISTYLTKKFNLLTRHLTNTGSTLSVANDPQGGFLSGILFGGLTALIWTPCAGPILAAVIVQTVIQNTGFMSFLTLVFFGIGAGVPMLIIALFGRSILTRLSYFKMHAVFFRKALGVIIILSISYMIYLEGRISTASIEKNNNNAVIGLQNGLSTPYPAPAISGIETWINSEPLQLNALKNHVVLVDCWTYSCINCLRTLPYLKDWYAKYHDKGLVIIGIHSPEFDFEKNIDNVKNAVLKDGIKYPVALDNQFATWLSFKNRYWPAHYLIDKNGNVVYTHFGEGEYDVTENNIRYLLGLKEPTSTHIVSENNVSASQTPETYLGYARAENFSSPEIVNKDAPAHYTFPNELASNKWALQGIWVIMPDRVISYQKNAAIKINFHARHVYVVMGNRTDTAITVTLRLNGERLTNQKGKDVLDSRLQVDKHSLYETIALNQSDDGVLELIASAPGLEVYTFTFGG